MIEDRSLRNALALLLLISASGVCYFKLAKGLDFIDALYHTTVTISTVGFSAPPDLTTIDKLFITILIAVGVTTAAYAISRFFSHVVEGELLNILGQRKMLKTISELENHIIICGMGRIGQLIAGELREQDKTVVCVDRDPEVLAELREKGFLAMEGDATTEQVLLDAGIERADTLVSAMPRDSESVFLTLTGRFLNPSIKIVARGYDEHTKRKLERAGANIVVLPVKIGGHRMTQAVLAPLVMDFFELASANGEEGLRMDEIHLKADAEFVGKDLAESNIRGRYGLMVIGIRQKNGEMKFNPDHDFKLQEGDVILALGRGKDLERIKAAQA